MSRFFLTSGFFVTFFLSTIGQNQIVLYNKNKKDSILISLKEIHEYRTIGSKKRRGDKFICFENDTFTILRYSLNKRATFTEIDTLKTSIHTIEYFNIKNNVNRNWVLPCYLISSLGLMYLNVVPIFAFNKGWESTETKVFGIVGITMLTISIAPTIIWDGYKKYYLKKHWHTRSIHS